MWKKMIPLGFLITQLTASLLANGMSETERLEFIEETNCYTGIPVLDKDSWLSHQIDKKILQNQELSDCLNQKPYRIVSKDLEIDMRELNMDFYDNFFINKQLEIWIEVSPCKIENKNNRARKIPLL
jgi:hypothetical protein